MTAHTPTPITPPDATVAAPLAVHPAEAAINLIDLDDDARQRAVALLERRAAAIDRVVLAHSAAASELAAALSVVHSPRVLPLAAHLHRAFEREFGDADLTDQLAAILPSADGQRLRRIVEECWRAVVDERGSECVEGIEAFVVRRRAGLHAFAREIERALAARPARAAG